MSSTKTDIGMINYLLSTNSSTAHYVLDLTKGTDTTNDGLQKNNVINIKGNVNLNVLENYGYNPLKINATGNVTLKSTVDAITYSNDAPSKDFVTYGDITSENGNIVLGFSTVGNISAPSGGVKLKGGESTNPSVTARDDVEIDSTGHIPSYSFSRNLESKTGNVIIGSLSSHYNQSINLKSTKAVVIEKLENNNWKDLNVDSPILVLPKSEDGKALIPPPDNFKGKVVYATEAEINDQAKLNTIINGEFAAQAQDIKEIKQKEEKLQAQYTQGVLEKIGNVPPLAALNIGVDIAVLAKKPSENIPATKGSGTGTPFLP